MDGALLNQWPPLSSIIRRCQQYIWAAPQGFNSAALFVLINPAPNDYYNQGSILQCDALMTWTIQCKYQ
ncbi:MAG: hypothetical protein EZS28_038006 [Streblomastix strix]|uniref:Uncharacterized protein n=1 Tax=Streblomastix strix TaxID=222440 RepID=A0A5J4U7A5_9EUKA|nr:MAG: hypothetical protein EZS28_038006 [Streblomastix strix]